MYGLLLLSVGFASLRSLFSKQMGIKTESNAAFLKLNGYIYLAAFFVLWLSGGKIESVSAFSIGMALLYGALSLLSQLFYMLSMRWGPMAVCTFFYSSGFAIPAILGACVWREAVFAWQVAGVVLLVISFAISLARPQGEKSGNRLWVVYAFLAMVASGFVGFMQKVHQCSPHKDELNAFLSISFLFATVLSFVLYGIRHKAEGKVHIENAPLGKLLASSLISGVCIAFANKINTILSGKMASMIFYPSVNGGVIILSAVLGSLLFREKRTKNEWLGLMLGLLAIVLVSIK